MNKILNDDIRNKKDELTQGELEFLLHRNTATRGLESCWMEGYYYASIGHDESKNPFKHNTIEHKYYSDGWWAGFYNEEPLFPEFSFDNKKVLNPINDEIALDTDNTLVAEPNNTPISPEINPDQENPKVSSGFLKKGGVLAGLGVAASVIAVFSVTLLDAA